MKKISLIVAIFVCGFVLVGCSKKTPVATNPNPTQRPRKPDLDANFEPVENRPYVSLTPRDDGKAVELTIISMKKPAENLQYTVEYNSGQLLQGAFGTIDSLATLPVTKEILLGSCSTGGKCTYNTNVTGGTLTLTFGNPDYTLKNEWVFTEGALKAKTFTSSDGKFALDVSGAKVGSNFVITDQAPGYPGTVDGKVISGPYMVSPADKITGTVSVSIRLPLDASAGVIEAFDGKSWTTWKSSVKDRNVVASGPMSTVFVVVTK